MQARKETRSTRPRKAAPESGNGAATSPRGWLNLRMLEIYVAVIQEKGMTAAAKRLGMTQSAVSQAINAIETGLGAQLIDRARRPAQTTLFGGAFYDRAMEVLHRARELEHLVDRNQHARLPQLRIGMVDSVVSTAGPALLRELAQVATRWTVVSGAPQTSIRSLAERRVDMILSNDDAASDPAFLALNVLREPFIIAVPRNFDVGRSTVHDLASRLPLMRYSTNGFLGPQVTAYLQQHDIALPSAYEFDTSDAVIAMVRSGMGWAITTPLCVLRAGTTHAGLKFLPLDRAPMRTLRVIAHKGENAALWERLATAARTILKRDWVPSMKRLAPWANVRVD